MSSIATDIELTDKYVIKELGICFDGKVQQDSFCPPIKYKPTKRAFWCTRNMQGTMWSSGRWDYNEFSITLPRALMGQYFAKEQKKPKFRQFIGQSGGKIGI